MELFDSQKDKNSLRDTQSTVEQLQEQIRITQQQHTENEALVFANKKLTANNLELQKSIDQLDSFSAIASHDLKEPLRKIMLFSNLVVEAEKNNISETSAKYLDRVMVSANRLQQLIDDLISYSRIGSEKIKFVKTDLNKLVNKACAELKDAKDDKNMNLVIDGLLPVVPVLPSQMLQLFVNLIGNAIKYSSKDVVLNVKISNEKATEKDLEPFEVKQGINYYKITVSDNGIGFPNEYKDVIFDAFKRLHGKDDYPGTGIGLAICKKIVANHGGFISAESEVGKGSRFNVFLPELQIK